MISRTLRLAVCTVAVCVVASAASAASCINRFVSRTERPHQIVTLLTGKLTFQEAQDLAAAIKEKKAPALEWVDDTGKTIARQFGDLRVVRPMPVGCDGKTSGVVVIVSFPTGVTPLKKIHVKLDAATIVTFEQQTD